MKALPVLMPIPSSIAWPPGGTHTCKERVRGWFSQLPMLPFRFRAPPPIILTSDIG